MKYDKVVCFYLQFNELVRKDVDVNEHERISNIILRRNTPM